MTLPSKSQKMSEKGEKLRESLKIALKKMVAEWQPATTSGTLNIPDIKPTVVVTDQMKKDIKAKISDKFRDIFVKKKVSPTPEIAEATA